MNIVVEGEVGFPPEETLKKKLIRNGFWLYFFTFIIAPTGYIIKLIAARSMSVVDVGLFYSIIGIVGIISSYNDFGLTEALQYFLPHYYIAKDYVKAKSLIIAAWVMQFITGIVIGLGLRLLAPWLSIHYFHAAQATEILRLFCIYFLFLNLFQVLQSIFLATQNIKASYGIDALRMRIIVIIFVIIRQWDAASVTTYTMTIAWIIGYVIAIFLALGIFRKKYGWTFKGHKMIWDIQLMKKRLGFARWIFLGANVSTVFYQIDQQFALYFLGAEAAGQRTVYLSLMTASTFLTGPLSSYLFPLVNELVHKKEHEKLRLLFKIIAIGLLCLAVVAGIVLHFFGVQITILLFGEKFRLSGEVLAFAAPYIILGPAIGFVFQFLGGSGKAKERVNILGMGLVVNIIANLILLPIMGLRGLVIGLAISYLFMGIITWFRVFRKGL